MSFPRGVSSPETSADVTNDAGLSVATTTIQFIYNTKWHPNPQLYSVPAPRVLPIDSKISTEIFDTENMSIPRQMPKKNSQSPNPLARGAMLNPTRKILNVEKLLSTIDLYFASLLGFTSFVVSAERNAARRFTLSFTSSTTAAYFLPVLNLEHSSQTIFAPFLRS
ncbi:hypothetical protein PCASD_14190 [Puccinia coronata f. sp. avenae]|uniref:Uncharacterized protein n=1 Tax=Puccinia coronata f. sp. avenae TaxID=200324 RepID=A0A2N5U3L9_9BASI|nr:hypothetical protein PCASD_14190 [Puccinia coronata f. sp. avenae]